MKNNRLLKTIVISLCGVAVIVSSAFLVLKKKDNEVKEKETDEKIQSSEYCSNVNINLLKGFYSNTVYEMLSNESENTLYSPVNLYMVSSMLAECTKSGSRDQLLNMIGCKDIYKIREQAKYIYNTNYKDKGDSKCILGNSLWFNQTLSYDSNSFNKTDLNIDTLNNICDNYHANTFFGNMENDQSFLKLYHDWLNEHTNNMLSDMIKDLDFGENPVMTLASAMYMKADWQKAFEGERSDQTFYNFGCTEVKCKKLFGKDKMQYKQYNKFQAVKKTMDDTNAGGMWFVLPNKDSCTDDVLKDKNFINMIFDNQNDKNTKKKSLKDKYSKYDTDYIDVDLSVPEFDISSKSDFIDKLKNLGVKDIFEEGVADFSNIFCKGGRDAYVSKFEQQMRVRIDQEKCEAAAAVEANVNSKSMPMKALELDIDRPFIFVVSGVNGMPLFVGVINEM